MSLTIHTLKPAHGSRSKSRRIGRGAGSGRGKTAGKGTKGQKSRTGGRKKLKLKGLKQMLLAFPKNRGFRSRRRQAHAITLTNLEKFEAGSSVTLDALRAKDMMTRRETSAKIVGTGKLTKALKLSGIAVTATAKAAIEAAGGSIS
ncbi:MAG: 50S ribosomal protein L15 [Candidatus Uhrbacteria bacterium]